MNIMRHWTLTETGSRQERHIRKPALAGWNDRYILYIVGNHDIIEVSTNTPLEDTCKLAERDDVHAVEIWRGAELLAVMHA